MTPEFKLAIKFTLDELLAEAIQIRADWSSFDGRNNLEFIDIWIAKICKQLGIDYHSLYEEYWASGAYLSHKQRFDEALASVEKLA